MAKVTCPACEGSGVVLPSTCWMCDGAGDYPILAVDGRRGRSVPSAMALARSALRDDARPLTAGARCKQKRGTCA